MIKTLAEKGIDGECCYCECRCYTIQNFCDQNNNTYLLVMNNQCYIQSCGCIFIDASESFPVDFG